MKPLLAFAAMTALTACVATAPITQPPVKVSFSNPLTATQVTAVDTMKVRARLRDGDTQAELADVPCELSGPGYSARFSTPAILELPIMNEVAPSLALSCQFERETKSVTLGARNISEEERQEKRQRALDDLDERRGGVAVILTLGLNSGRSGPDEFRYPDSTFTFRR